tara:strand:- start:1079 stop:2257 length:1179 start_codon:yes stop_codon:yes gene_type:complete
MAATTQPRIFKKIEIIEGGGHHGGGWKVAYADFMTAMMAFFLLMWILASADEQKLRGIAEYFTNATLPGGTGVLDGATLGPPGTLTASNGSVVARGSELGMMDDPTPANWEVNDTTASTDPKEKVLGSQVGKFENPAAAAPLEDYVEPSESTNAVKSGEKSSEAQQNEHALDDSKFKQLQQEILQAMEQNPDLDPLKQNIIFEQSPEGLLIQIIDQKGRAMFHSGRAEMQGATELLLQNLGKSLSSLPNKLTISGHTDAVRFTEGGKYDNWDLSADRANATRRVFEASGVARNRVIRVSGLADTDPLIPENPVDPSNRRISIYVQYQKTNDMPPHKEAASAINSQSHSTATNMQKSAALMEVPSTTLAADYTTPREAPLDGQVFQNLRNALR